MAVALAEGAWLSESKVRGREVCQMPAEEVEVVVVLVVTPSSSWAGVARR